MILYERLRSILTTVLLFVLLMQVSFAANSSMQLIEQDVAVGTIAPEEGTILEAIALVRPEALPSQYRSVTAEPPGKCATGEVRAAMDIIMADPERFSSYREIMSRPTSQAVVQSELGYFLLHYDTSGTHAVPLADLDGNSIPDWVDRAADFADSCWLYQVNTLGHLPPPSDGTMGGGLDKYDIYFQRLGVYGYTQAEIPGPAAWNDYTSHIVVHNNYVGFPPNHDPEGNQIGALKVTIAHEFYHAIQFAYDVGEDLYFMEQSSTWMEEMAYPQVNDNYNYLPYFFSTPQTGLQATGNHMYAAFVWPKYLQERFGATIMASIWNDCRFNSSLGAWNNAVVSRGSTLRKELTRFHVWNYHTGDRATPSAYESGADYPQVHVMRYSETIPDSDRTSSEPPQPLASNYIVINNYIGSRGILAFDFTGMVTAAWGIGYVIDYGSGQYLDSIKADFENTHAIIYIPRFENVLRVTFIPGVTSTYGEYHNFSYDLYWRSAGDINADSVVDISDAVAGIRYIFGGGEAPQPVEAMDANCDGINDISDVTYLIAFIFGGGPPPCP